MAYPTSFKNGNQAAKKNPKIVIRKFFEMLELSKNDSEVLCFQDACKKINWRQSKVEYWVKKIPVFETLKKDIQANIISRINKGALIGDYQPTASIWRQKQLGESDISSSNIDVKSSDGSMKMPVFLFKDLNEAQ